MKNKEDFIVLDSHCKKMKEISWVSNTNTISYYCIKDNCLNLSYM